MKLTSFIKRLLSPRSVETPHVLIPACDYPVFEILNKKLGHSKSKETSQPVDADGNPIPWYTYPAIEYLRQLDFSGKSVFEFGSGNSTLFWSSRASHVVAVESNMEWYERCRNVRAANVKLRLERSRDDYVSSILDTASMFDIIVVDGDHRMECAKKSLDCLNPSGMIILDNSDWFPRTAEFLRSQNLIQVDFSGFGPVNDYTWTTSIFLTRSFEVVTHSKLPQHPVGGLIQYGQGED